MINQVPEVPLDRGRVEDELEIRASPNEMDALLQELALGRRSVERFELARAQIERLTGALPLPVIRLPLVLGSGISVEDLQRLGRLLTGGAAQVFTRDAQ